MFLIENKNHISFLIVNLFSLSNYANNIDVCVVLQLMLMILMITNDTEALQFL